MANEKIKQINKDPGSFRDPSSQVYTENGVVVRSINPSYYPDYDQLIKSGLYTELVDTGLLIKHRQIYRGEKEILIIPEKVPLISYPFEWSFSQIQEAAINTLLINEKAMTYKMILKDASAYNMQLVNNQMCLIDTCSFMKYEQGMPWGPYSQFLRHFASPMALIKWDDPFTTLKLLQTQIDGIPVPFAARRMPLRSRFSFGMWAHIFSQSLKFAYNPKRSVKMNHVALRSLLNNLFYFVASMKYKPLSGYLQYAEYNNYNPKSLTSKRNIVNYMITMCPGETFLDIGANTGEYSKIAATLGKDVISIDVDHDCINEIYKCGYAQPLVVDICQPSPAIGWANKERKSFWDRVGVVDCCILLAVIHHLCLKDNIPLELVAELLKDHARVLIIEWVPPDDPKAVQLLGKKMVPRYDHQTFLEVFDRYFNIGYQSDIAESKRILYYMERKA